MSESPNTRETIRHDEVLGDVIRRAIIEVIDTLGSDMTERDRQMLLSVTNERSTPAVARVIYLTQTLNSAGVSPNYKQFINQVLETLRQELTVDEQKLFLAPFTGSVLRDVQ